MYDQNFEDKELQCVECSATYVFSAGDQEFFAEKGFTPPKRCPECRSARKANRGGSRGGYNKPQYEVVCSDCGCQTTVPFEPRDDRPVYCSDCYRKQY